jgi:hypothetical protein
MWSETVAPIAGIRVYYRRDSCLLAMLSTRQLMTDTVEKVGFAVGLLLFGNLSAA